MADRTYRCSVCRDGKTWPDEAAEQECLAVFGLDPVLGGCDIVCDDYCYRKIMATP